MTGMSRRVRWGKLLALGAVFAALLVNAGSSVAAVPAPGWTVESHHFPTNFSPGSVGRFMLVPTNVGNAPSSGVITVADTLPAGMTATAISGIGWTCELATVSCTSEGVLQSGGIGSITLTVQVDPGANGRLTNSVSVSGGGASAPAVGRDAIEVTTAEPSFEVVHSSFVAKASRADGGWESGAGAHPYLAMTSLDFATSLKVPGFVGQLKPVGSPKDLSVDLPPGFVGNPRAVPRCTVALLAAEVGQQCPVASQVGTVLLGFGLFGQVPAIQGPYPIYNLVPGEEEPALLGFNYQGNVQILRPRVRAGGDYGISIDVRNISQNSPGGLLSTTVTLWGVPADPSHDFYRFAVGKNCTNPTICVGTGTTTGGELRPFLTNPTDCTRTPLTMVSTDSWQQAGAFTEPFAAEPPPPATGCDRLTFRPAATFDPSASQAESPSGFAVHIHDPQNEDPKGVVTPALKKAVVALPEGMAVNPSSADGLGGCTMDQAQLRSQGDTRCPESANIGTVSIATPLLDKPVEGDVYLAAQKDNPFGSLLALYIVARGPGFVIKLPGKVETDPHTGQLKATFDDNPQLPFEDLSVQFKSGPRAPLITPARCGTYTTEAALTPWAAADASPVVTKSSFEITSGPNGSPCPNNDLKPKLNAGTANPVGGSSSTFNLQLSRDDATQQFTALDVSMPEGLTAKLAGVPYCSDAALGSYPSPAVAGTGAAELASPKCPAASQVGTATVGAGAGSNPFYVRTGKVYLAGPYKGQPLSLAIVTPAVAGPFDLGTVVVRSAIHVDPATAKISVASDPIPTILEGIPLDVRDIRVSVDRTDFMRNPTSCDPMAVDATVHGAQGATAQVSNRFQVGSCERLAFKPDLHLRLFGGTKRSDHPKFRAVLTQKPGQANIDYVQVALPHSEFLEQGHIKTICTRVQYAAKACPPGSVYGYAKAFSPLLDQPLEGPVYLRSSSNPLPDLVASLDGQIHIDLAGKIDSVRGGIRNTFAVVPDAPVSKFILTMQGGKKGLLVNSRNLCKSTNRATVKMDGQNGKAHDFRPVLRNSCKKKHK